MKVFERSFKILSTQADVHRRLRLSALFSLFQEAAIAHTEALGVGRDKTLDRGLLWAVAMQRAQVTRLPEYDETVTLISWPGETMHVLFPRYYQLLGADGTALVRGSALWVLLDMETRKLFFPESAGIQIPGVTTGDEISLPTALRTGVPTGEGVFVVPYSAVDLNGHMNNARYFDLAQDRMPPAMRDIPLREAAAEYCGEAPLGAEIRLKERFRPGCYSLWGESEGRSVFRLSLTVGES